MSSQLPLRLLPGKLLQPGHWSSTADKPSQRRNLPYPTLLRAGETRTFSPLRREPSTGCSRPSSFASGSQRISTENLDICKGLLRPSVSARPHWGLENLYPSALWWPGWQPCPLIALALPPNHGTPCSLLLSEGVEETKGPRVGQGRRTGYTRWSESFLPSML